MAHTNLLSPVSCRTKNVVYFMIFFAMQDVMQDERLHFKASAKRDTPVKENQRLFQLLLKGDKEAESFCLRAKAQYDSTNGESRR